LSPRKTEIAESRSTAADNVSIQRPVYQLLYQYVNHFWISQSREFSVCHMVFIELYLSNPANSLSHEIAGAFVASREKWKLLPSQKNNNLVHLELSRRC